MSRSFVWPGKGGGETRPSHNNVPQPVRRGPCCSARASSITGLMDGLNQSFLSGPVVLFRTIILYDQVARSYPIVSLNDLITTTSIH